MAIRLLYLTRWITLVLACLFGAIGLVLAITEPALSAGWILIGFAVLRISAQKAITAESERMKRESSEPIE
ncbi:MAG: hypothetical protein JWQ43_4023 [Glaciihabitans sp.]|nr:hypothetical protein [Glaciihabitans sp.]